MDRFNEKQKVLKQLYVPDTAVNVLLAPQRKLKALVSEIRVANLSGSAVNVRLFVSTTNTTFTNANAIVYDKSLAANDVLIYQFDIPIGVEYPGGAGIQVNTANVVTTTWFGCEAEGGSNGV